MTTVEADKDVGVFESAIDGFLLNHSDFNAHFKELTGMPQGIERPIFLHSCSLGRSSSLDGLSGDGFVQWAADRHSPARVSWPRAR
ncbi:hypothetical protein [Bradyrhizobium niftali]|uniref:Uncharacterized protein n=1 Tax=Bradyrhizobium niftali TaxID=2560055 RepID=A0A4Y9M3N8_9BRAD|nr:hypothetical protein [Bradyrhizobium niftali]TFV49712.1 hypothetical protein E4K65_05905 [Bradyrhizobium niftali]